jgi:hypothetical protein
MFMPSQQNHILEICHKCFQNLMALRYLATTPINQRIRREPANNGSMTYGNMETKMYKTVILPFAVYGNRTWWWNNVRSEVMYHGPNYFTLFQIISCSWLISCFPWPFSSLRLLEVMYWWGKIMIIGNCSVDWGRIECHVLLPLSV